MNHNASSVLSAKVSPGPSAALDPISIELIRNNFLSICEEMAESLVRSAHSPNIKERRDCSCGLYTATGEMAVQAEHIPIHLGVMPYALKYILQSFANDDMRPGDAFIVNDPYYGGNHLPDLIIASPIFLEDRLLGFAASMAHHNDVGGLAPRSMPAAAVEIFQEGLRIPPVRLARNWVLDEGVMRLITANSRTPSERIADVRAQVAVARLAQRRVEEIGRRYPAAIIENAFQEILNRSESAMRAAIAALPDGEWLGESFADFGGQMIALKVRIGKSATGDLVIDFAGTDGVTKSPFNSCLSNTCACVFMALRVALAGDIPPNGGLYRPIDIRVPEGSILNPQYPAAVSAATQVSYHTFEALMRAFAPLAPQRVMADSGGAGVFSFGGVHPRTGQLFAYGEALGGGSGANMTGDGESAVMPPVSNLHDTPVETLEMALPLRIERYELVEGSAGRGRFRGGLGFRRAFRMLAPVRCSFQLSMAHKAPGGILGGQSGAPTRITIVRHSGETVLVDRFMEQEVEAGGLVVIESAGGGGIGPEEQRDPDARARDQAGSYFG